MAQIFLDDSKLVSMANVLREATETTEPLVFPEGFNEAIGSLANGVKLPKLNNPASENQILSGYEVIDENGEIKTGTIPTVEQAVPDISITSDGLITASVAQIEGYIEEGASSATQQLVTQGAKTITPSTSEQTAVVAGVYTTGDIKVAAMPVVEQATPSISVSSSGLITASATQSAGYVPADTKSATKQMTVQAAKTVTPTTNEQTAVAAGVYTTGAIKVAAMSTSTQATPSISISSAGLITASATQTAGYVSAGIKNATKQLTTKGATTITPSKSEQTAVAAGVYTTGEIKVAAYTPNTTTLTATANGTYKPTGYDGYSSVTVAIPVYDGT